MAKYEASQGSWKIFGKHVQATLERNNKAL